MLEGDCVSFVISPLIFPVRITPRIVKCAPGEEIVWVGSRFGIRAEHTFNFRESGSKVVLTSIETFRGAIAALSTFIFLPERLHRLVRELLASIKREAEARFAAVEADGAGGG